MTDKPNYSLKDLLNELKEKEKGCGKRFEISENRLAICGKYYYDEKEQTLCPTCQAEISALKKGISACEEILNSQQIKKDNSEGSNTDYLETQNTTEEVKKQEFKSGCVDNQSVDTEQEKAEGVVYPKGDSDTSPVQTLMKEMSHYKSRCVDLMCENDELKQALSKRNKEILEIIEKITSWTCKCGCITFDDKKCRMCGSNPAYGEIDYKELKQQLTEGEGKE